MPDLILISSLKSYSVKEGRQLPSIDSSPTTYLKKLRNLSAREFKPINFNHSSVSEMVHFIGYFGNYTNSFG